MHKMNKNFWGLAIVGLLFSLSLKNFSSAYSQSNPLNVAVANYEKLVKNMPDFNKSEEEFREIINSQQKIQKEEMEALKKMEEEFKAKEKTWSKEERELRKKNIDEKRKALQRKMMEIQIELQDKNNAIMDKMKKNLDEKYIDPIAKKNNIDLILDSESIAKIYNKGLDITEEVLNAIKKDNPNPDNSDKKAGSTAKK